jgi:hypothetical protein
MGNCHDCKDILSKTEFALVFPEHSSENIETPSTAPKSYICFVPVVSKLIACWRGYSERKQFSHIYKQCKPEYTYFDISEVQETLSKHIGLANHKVSRKEHRLKTGKYTGEWCGGFRQGFGVMEFNDGCKYEGHWKYSRPCGSGKFFYKNGEGYQGDWKMYFVFSKSIFRTGKLEKWKECVQDGYCKI